MKNLILTAALLAVGFATVPEVRAQTTFLAQSISISLSGTSNIHDWDMKAGKGTSIVSFVMDKNGVVTGLSKLSLNLVAKNLKSTSRQMDKNTYKALNTDKNPNISFVMTSARVTRKSTDNYVLNCTGTMSIAGKQKKTELVANARYNPADKTFTINGEKKMNMTDYKVKPPTALAGTIKTGDAITISYSLILNRQVSILAKD